MFEVFEAERENRKSQNLGVAAVRRTLKNRSNEAIPFAVLEKIEPIKTKTEDEGLMELERFGEKWDEKYPQIS